MYGKYRNYMYLAPWRAILNLKGYHGDLSEDEIGEVLKDEKVGTFILTNYNSKGDHLRLFTLSIVCDTANGRQILHANRFTNRLPQNLEHNFHIFNMEGHPNECFFGKSSFVNLICKRPHSLKNWCRATISENFTFERIVKLHNANIIPTDLYNFIIQQCSKDVPYKYFMFCEELTDYICVYQNTEIKQEIILLNSQAKVHTQYIAL